MSDSYFKNKWLIQDASRFPTKNEPSTYKIDMPKILQNLILTPPPESQYQPLHSDIGCIFPKQLQFNIGLKLSGTLIEKFNQFSNHSQSEQVQSQKQDQDLRVKVKSNKKGKRDGENIRTYARYDSVIQALEEELAANQILSTNEDKKLLDQFEMKSKRSLQRFFFYLLLAKRENKLKKLLPILKIKINEKIQQKSGHRTQQFLSCLQNCIQKYLDAAQKLQKAKTLQEAKSAFSIAYLSGTIHNGNAKRPHHNKIKGVDKCLEIYKIIMQESLNLQKQKNQFEQPKLQIKDNQNLQQVKINNNEIQFQNFSELIKVNPIPQTRKRSSFKNQDQSYSILEQDLLQNTNQRKKKVGIKNKKQDDRDIQKYAKFDIVSQSSLQFLKKQKLQKNIPQICKKLSQRSLHFFFVILALIQKEKKEVDFLNHLEFNYSKKVQKRYVQRSQYFRQRLYITFHNLIQATRKLFQGNLEQALIIAYEVKSDRKPHPAKASQQKKCKQIYEATRYILEGHLEQSRAKLQNLIQNEKTHRSQLIRCLKPMKIQNQIDSKLVQVPNSALLTSSIQQQLPMLSNLKQQQKTRCYSESLPEIPNLYSQKLISQNFNDIQKLKTNQTYYKISLQNSVDEQMLIDQPGNQSAKQQEDAMF